MTSAADALGFLDERRARVAGADQAGADLDARAPRLDARALEHRAPVRLLLLEARLERELAGHGQHEDRVDDARLRRSAWRRSCSAEARDVVAEDRHERGAVVELLEVGRALGARDAVGAPAGRGPGGGGRGSSRPSRPPSRGCRSCAPRRAAPRPRTRRRTCRSRRAPPSAGSCCRGCARSRASGRGARGRAP